MTTFIYFTILFAVRVLDNTLNTTKTILIQRNRCLLAGLTVIVSDYLYFTLIKNVLTSSGNLAVAVVAVAGGVGCCLAVGISQKLSRDRTFVNVIMSDDKEAMQKLRDFLALHHITNVATDSYTLDWNTRTITVTAYAETRAESNLIDRYIAENTLKCKRVIQKT